ncbi:hypothetical protein K1719_041551 [Acacia pycnantha]|nr:hypothetical protein K1719_041551 [Acacia pycnantha]
MGACSDFNPNLLPPIAQTLEKGPESDFGQASGMVLRSQLPLPISRSTQFPLNRIVPLLLLTFHHQYAGLRLPLAVTICCLAGPGRLK